MKTLTYALVFVALLALLGLTLAGHALHWGFEAALLIAAAKAILVAIFFMHLNASSNTVRAAACGGLVFLAVLMALTLNDYSTRGDLALPRQTQVGQQGMK